MFLFTIEIHWKSDVLEKYTLILKIYQLQL